jgi:two-component system, LytTR family, sensor kinase
MPALNRSLFGDNKVKILIHLLAWLILILMPFYFSWRFKFSSDILTILYYINLVINGIIFYSNYLFLLPRLYFSGKKLRYLISLLLFLTAMYFGSYWTNIGSFNILRNMGMVEKLQLDMAKQGNPENRDRNKFPERPPSWDEHIIHFGTTSIFLAFLALAIRTIERNNRIEKEQKELRQEKLSAELALLKHQISPHFLFNTLNNIYSLTAINPEDSRDAILKLSRMMRYLLYDTETEETRLSNEIALMNDYVDLMRLRLEKNYDLRLFFPAEYTEFRLPPLLFIPFIENAFKHGISFRDTSFIEIRLETTADSVLFRCANSIAPQSSDPFPEASGVGLNNVRKRLELLFPGKYVMKVDRTESIYEVMLNIRILP